MTEADPESEVSALADELAMLHRGRGLRRSPLLPLLGPRLREVLDVGDGSDEVQVRAVLAEALFTASESLDPDLRTSFRHAAGLVTDERLLKDRLGAVGTELDRDQRTVRRRVERANSSMAEQLLIEHRRRIQDPNAPSGWTVTSMRSDLDLTGGRAAVTADKVILALRPLTELTESFYLSLSESGSTEPTVDIEVIGGGRLQALERVEERNWRYRIALDQPLNRGERHNYQVRITVSPNLNLPPYNAVAPLRSCEEFVCRVRFSPDQLPARVQRIDGLPTSVFNDPVGTRNLLPVGQVVASTFRHLAPGLAYGLRWTF